MKPSLRFAILERDGFKCRYCGATGAESELEVDHVDPLANGGTDAEENLVTSCFSCNRGKSARVIEMPFKAAKSSADPIVGTWFHSFEPCLKCGNPAVRWQGRVLGALPSGTYLVQLFDWGMGEPTSQRLVRPETLEGWAFYEDATDMRWAWNEVLKFQHDGCL